MENVVRANEFADAGGRAVTQPVASIIIPIHNEESFLAGALAELQAGLAETGVAYELLLCENGSTDKTRELAFSLAEEEPHTRLLTSDLPDYGGAMKMGVLAANGPHIIVFDIDYSSVDFMNEALALLEDYDVVLASKLAPDTEDKRGLARQTITRGFSLVLKILFNTKLSDTHGMKAFRRKKIEPLVLQSRMSKDLFDTELILRAERNGLRIKEIPVVIEEKRAARSSILKRIPRTVFGLLRLRYYFTIESRRKPGSA
ncbi:MAG: glycosyltransferase family 2 protein [Candidatus Aquicultor sp.]|nr:glycosyltransferase family 2 protein [Candidatus Aquicultor sp.]